MHIRFSLLPQSLPFFRFPEKASPSAAGLLSRDPPLPFMYQDPSPLGPPVYCTTPYLPEPTSDNNDPPVHNP